MSSPSTSSQDTAEQQERQGYPPRATLKKKGMVGGSISSMGDITVHASLASLLSGGSGFVSPNMMMSCDSSLSFPPSLHGTESSSGSCSQLDYSLDYSDDEEEDDHADEGVVSGFDKVILPAASSSQAFVPLAPRADMLSRPYLPNMLRPKARNVSFSAIDELCEEDTDMDRFALRARSPKVEWYPSKSSSRSRSRKTKSGSDKISLAPGIELSSPTVMWYPSSSSSSSSHSRCKAPSAEEERHVDG